MQQLFANLAGAGKMSMTKFFESVGENYDDEMDNLKKEQIAQAVMQVEVAIESRYAETSAAQRISTKNSEISSERADFVKTCINEAMPMMSMDPSEVELQLMLMDAEDPAMALEIRRILESIQQSQAAAVAAANGEAAEQPGGGKPTPDAKPTEGQQ